MTNSNNQPSSTESEHEVADDAATSPPVAAEESTVGTGTFFALGCSLAAIAVILIGIVIILLVR